MRRLFRKKEFVEWDSYKAFIDQVDDYLWQQRVRAENLRNTPGPAEA